MDDVIAVLDAVGSETASILGVSEGGCLAAALAATYPHRVSRIILYGTVAQFRQDAEHRGFRRQLEPDAGRLARADGLL